jgi:hypothetical protein
LILQSLLSLQLGGGIGIVGDPPVDVDERLVHCIFTVIHSLLSLHLGGGIGRGKGGV